MSYQSEFDNNNDNNYTRYTTLHIQPQQHQHYNNEESMYQRQYNSNSIMYKIRNNIRYIFSIATCIICICIGYKVGQSSNKEIRYVDFATYTDIDNLHYYTQQEYDNSRLVSAKDFESSTINPSMYNITSHIVGTTTAIYQQYVPLTPTLFPVLRLAPTVHKRCASEIPVVEIDDDSNGDDDSSSHRIIGHDSRYAEQIEQENIYQKDIIYPITSINLHERQSKQKHDDSGKHSDDECNDKRDDNDHSRHHRSKHKHCSLHHGSHSDHHIYHGHDDESHKSQLIQDDHSEHHHTIRRNHTHNKYDFDDIDYSEDIPPPTYRFNWCYNCTDRCHNVINAIEFNVRNSSSRDRRMKLTQMAASLPRFFRGVDHLYLEDVFNLPYNSKFFKYSSIRTRTFVSGDQHLYNYGTYDNSRNQIIYDYNDYDQVLIDNYHIDLWRTATSLVIHMRLNNIHIEEQNRILYDFASTYYTTVQSFVGNDNELYAYLHENNTEGIVYETLYLAKEKNSNKKMLDSLCYYDSNHIRRLDDSGAKSLEPVTHKIYDMIEHYWPNYISSLGNIHRNITRVNHTELSFEWDMHSVSTSDYFKIKSIASRVGAGLGSLGVSRYYVLIEGLTNSQDDDIILDVKYEPTPEWWNFVHDDVRQFNGHFISQGQRIASGIHALTAHVPMTVGYFDMSGGSYVVRPRSPYKAQVDVDSLLTPIRFHSFSQHLAVINGINHARADNDYNPRLIPYSFEEQLVAIVKGDIDGFANVIKEYAFMNADRITDDFNCFVESGIAYKERPEYIDKAKNHKLKKYH